MKNLLLHIWKDKLSDYLILDYIYEGVNNLSGSFSVVCDLSWRNCSEVLPGKYRTLVLSENTAGEEQNS